MSHPTLDKYRRIAVIDDDAKLNKLSKLLQGQDKANQRAFFGGDDRTGWFYLYAHPTVPGVIMEAVQSRHGDSVISLYAPDAVFNSVGELMKARAEVIEALSASLGLSVQAIGVEDPARGRALGVEEIAFGQLIDLLGERVISTQQSVVDNLGNPL